MTAVAAALIGYLLGTLPTAQALGSLWDVDLRREGSGNPGANNARRLGGLGLAGLVLGVEAAKGVAAVLLGFVLAGDAGAVTAGISAVAGNVYNVWYRFRGGKGLGISAGVLSTLWPPGFVICLAVIVLSVLITRSSGFSALATIATLNTIGVGWWLFDWPNGWGIAQPELLVVLAIGITVVIWRKHWTDWVIKRRALQTPRG